MDLFLPTHHVHILPETQVFPDPTKGSWQEEKHRNCANMYMCVQSLQYRMSENQIWLFIASNCYLCDSRTIFSKGLVDI